MRKMCLSNLKRMFRTTSIVCPNRISQTHVFKQKLSHTKVVFQRIRRTVFVEKYISNTKNSVSKYVTFFDKKVVFISDRAIIDC